jgi:transglutaminase-like putative cysteine protease
MNKRFILLALCSISLFYQLSCQKNDKYIEEKIGFTNSTVYRCIVTHSFRKTREGKKINTIFFSVPRSNDYQEISNYYNSKGEILFDTITNESYLKCDLSNDMSTESGDWFQISFEFDYIAKSTKFTNQIVGEIYPYKSESTIHKMYTAGWYDEIDLNNPALLNVSKEIWDKSANIYDYARKCFEYVDVNFYYTDKYNYNVPLTFLLEIGGGNCFQFSQILITLLRMKNIPARYVRTWQHTWAEFYLENYGWIPADPTFSLFGKAPSGYQNEIIWNSNMTYHVENPSEATKNSF